MYGMSGKPSQYIYFSTPKSLERCIQFPPICWLDPEHQRFCERKSFFILMKTARCHNNAVPDKYPSGTGTNVIICYYLVIYPRSLFNMQI